MQDFPSLNDLMRVMKNVSIEESFVSNHAHAFVPRKNQEQQQKQQQSTASKERCYNCNKVGHWHSQCPKPRRAPGSCYNCGSREHMVSNCRKRPQSSAARRWIDPTTTRSSTQSQSADPDATTHVLTAEKPKDPLLQPSKALTAQVQMQLKPTDKFCVCFLAIVDSGSPVSLITEEIIPMKLWQPAFNEVRFLGLNSSEVEIKGKIERTITLDGIKLDVIFYIVSKGTMLSPCLIGRDAVCKVK